MIKVVIDTNIVVSANLIDEGPSAAILDLAANRRILMFVSPAILAEYEEAPVDLASNSIRNESQIPWPSSARRA